jgi:hypothetical protein
MFPVRRVQRESAESLEQLGSKRKFWFRDGPRRYLFKAEERGTGEDWAEVVVCHLCKLLGLPHVDYELAEEWSANSYVGPGVICENFAAPPLSLALGNQLLLHFDPNYPAGQRFRVRQHSVGAILEVLDTIWAPGDAWMSNASSTVNSARGVFVGYLLLDAWTANQDRHHENWGAIADDAARLAPTYDHGAALARNLDDEERQDRLLTTDRGRTVAAFSRRAKSAIYSDPNAPKSLTTLAAYSEFARAAPDAAEIWRQRLAAVEAGSVRQILDEVPPPRMTRIAKEFTMELLLANQRRILDED